MKAIPSWLRAPLSIWTVYAIVIPLCVGLTAWLIYGEGNYATAIFIFLPLFMGFAITFLYQQKRPLRFKQALGWVGLGMVLYCLALALFAIEGLICMIMALPIGIPFAMVGISFSLTLQTYLPDAQRISFWLLLFAIPTTAFVERDLAPTLHPVSTSVVIDADPQTVWDVVMAFPPLGEPEHWLFKMGIAYPTHAELNGEGVGAVRRCYFTTGAFVEPITVWDEPNQLAFTVEEYPEPMKELSFWDLDAPHLHDYFVSKRGQFDLIALPDGRTELQGTTWYEHAIYPERYWKLWSDYLLHTIHRRVLNQVKVHAEANGATNSIE